MGIYDSVKKYEVSANNVRDFCERYYARRCYHWKDEETRLLIQGHHSYQISKFGFTFIPAGRSATGKPVSYYK